ncbi:MAG: hypothetical protein AAGI01_08045, partial [Myxococcota bacterium]
MASRLRHIFWVGAWLVLVCTGCERVSGGGAPAGSLYAPKTPPEPRMYTAGRRVVFTDLDGRVVVKWRLSSGKAIIYEDLLRIGELVERDKDVVSVEPLGGERRFEVRRMSERLFEARGLFALERVD